jgi:hypothetical protein
MAAIVLARRSARGEVFKSGASPCMGFLTLSEFAPEFARWKITTRMEQVAAGASKRRRSASAVSGVGSQREHLVDGGQPHGYLLGGRMAQRAHPALDCQFAQRRDLGIHGDGRLQ